MTHYITFTAKATLLNGEYYCRKVQLPFEENETLQAFEILYAIFLAGYLTVNEYETAKQQVFIKSVTADIRRL